MAEIKLKITKHINSKLVGLVCTPIMNQKELEEKIQNKGVRYIEVKFKNNIATLIHLDSIKRVEDDTPLSDFPNIRERKINNDIEINGIGESKPLVDNFVDPLKGVKASPVGLEKSKPKKKIPSFF